VRLNRLSGVLTLALALVTMTAGSAQVAAAQNAVTSADIQRLQDSIYDASRDVEQARVRNSVAAAQLQQELDEARDEVVYLRVKLRKNEPIARSEYSSLRERIEDIRTRARGDGNVRPAPSATVPDEGDRRPVRAGTRSGEDVPVGTELDVRLQTALSSKTALVEDRFEATTMVEVSEGDRVLIPAGSVLRGVVSSVNKAGRIERQGKLTLAFDQITVKGRSYPIRATVTQALESEGIRGESGRIGAGAGVGAIIGGILGGLKGALTGILIGAGGTIAATEGTDVELPAGTVLRIRLDTPLDLR
jgi:TolA-binding protein